MTPAGGPGRAAVSVPGAGGGFLPRFWGGNPEFAWHAALILTLLASGLAIVFNLDVAKDVAGFYARETREFAAGRWPLAFFPYTPPLMVALAGPLAWLGLEPYTAVKSVSAFFYVAALWPLRALLRQLVPASLVGWGCLLYAVNSHLIRFMTGGLLDPLKTFFLLCLAALLVGLLRRPVPAEGDGWGWRWALAFGAALGGLCLCRAEGAFFALPWLAVPLLWPCRGAWHRGGWPAAVRRGVGLTVVALGVCLCLCLPRLLQVYRLTGIPALDYRQTVKIQKVLAAVGLATPPVPTKGEDEIAGLPFRPDFKESDRRTWQRSVLETYKGFTFWGLALSAVGLLWRGGRLRLAAAPAPLPLGRADVLLGALLLFNVLLFASNGFIIKRYVAPTLPLLLPWMVMGVYFLKVAVLDRLRPWLFPVLAVAFCAGNYLNGLRLIRYVHPQSMLFPYDVGQWIAANRDWLTPPGSEPRGADFRVKDIRDGRLPVLAATTPQYAFWAAADYHRLQGNYVITPERLGGLIRRHRSQLLVADADFQRACPGFTGREPWVEKVPNVPFKDLALYRIRRAALPVAAVAAESAAGAASGDRDQK